MDPLSRSFEDLKVSFPNANLDRRADGSALVTIAAFDLPPGWNAQQTTVAFVVPVGYPIARPDCFWTDPVLRLASGTQPAGTQFNANYGGATPMLWFSYHLSSWNPNGGDNLRTYTRVIRTRFLEPR
jgi:hypothetical protein